MKFIKIILTALLVHISICGFSIVNVESLIAEWSEFEQKDTSGIITDVTFPQSVPVGIDSVDEKLEILATDTSKIIYLLKVSLKNDRKSELLPYTLWALHLAEKIKSDKYIAQSYSVLARMYYFNLDYNKTILYSKKAAIYNERQNNYDELIENYHSSARSYFYLGYYDLSIHEKIKAVFLAEKIADSLTICELYRSIGYSYIRLGEKELAMDYFQKSLKISLEKEYDENNAYNYTEIGNYYYLSNNLAKAIEYASKALQLSRSIELHHAETLSAMLLSRSYLGINELDSAIKYCEVGLNYMPSVRRNEAVMLASKIYLKQGDVKKALLYLDSSYNFTQKMHNNVLMDEVFDTYQKIYKKTGDANKHLLYKDLQIANYTNIIRDANKQKMKNIEILNQIDEFEKENRLLEQYKEENEIELRISRVINIVSAIVIIIGLAILILAYFALRKIRLSNLTILNQKEEIRVINENLEQLVRSRTRKIESQNQKLRHYAYSNSHQVRAPLARLMGLIDLWSHEEISMEEKSFMMKEMAASVHELDDIVKDISLILTEDQQRPLDKGEF